MKKKIARKLVTLTVITVLFVGLWVTPGASIALPSEPRDQAYNEYINAKNKHDILALEKNEKLRDYESKTAQVAAKLTYYKDVAFVTSVENLQELRLAKEDYEIAKEYKDEAEANYEEACARQAELQAQIDELETIRPGVLDEMQQAYVEGAASCDNNTNTRPELSALLDSFENAEAAATAARADLANKRAALEAADADYSNAMSFLEAAEAQLNSKSAQLAALSEGSEEYSQALLAYEEAKAAYLSADADFQMKQAIYESAEAEYLDAVDTLNEVQGYIDMQAAYDDAVMETEYAQNDLAMMQEELIELEEQMETLQAEYEYALAEEDTEYIEYIETLIGRFEEYRSLFDIWIPEGEENLQALTEEMDLACEALYDYMANSNDEGVPEYRTSQAAYVNAEIELEEAEELLQIASEEFTSMQIVAAAMDEPYEGAENEFLEVIGEYLDSKDIYNQALGVKCDAEAAREVAEEAVDCAEQRVNALQDEESNTRNLLAVTMVEAIDECEAVCENTEITRDSAYSSLEEARLQVVEAQESYDNPVLDIDYSTLTSLLISEAKKRIVYEEFLPIYNAALEAMNRAYQTYLDRDRELKTVGGVSGLKLQAGKKKVTVRHNGAYNASGYQIYRSTKKSSGYKKVATTSSTTYVNSKLKAKKYYYYKIRPYRYVDGMIYYGPYSSPVRVKTK